MTACVSGLQGRPRRGAPRHPPQRRSPLQTRRFYACQAQGTRRRRPRGAAGPRGATRTTTRCAYLASRQRRVTQRGEASAAAAAPKRPSPKRRRARAAEKWGGRAAAARCGAPYARRSDVRIPLLITPRGSVRRGGVRRHAAGAAPGAPARRWVCGGARAARAPCGRPPRPPSRRAARGGAGG